MTGPWAGGSSERPDPVKVGSIRPSQTTHTFGPGGIVELPYMSVVVPGLDTAGLDPWQTRPGRAPIIEEERLLREVRRDLGPHVVELRTAPWMESPIDNRVSTADWVGLWAMPFPRWQRCTECKALSRVDGGLFEVQVDLYAPHEAGWWHMRCPKRGGGKARALPVRFVIACRNGHMDDFPWAEWAHRKIGYSCPGGAGARRLKLLDTNYAQRSTSQKVRCDECNNEERMTAAFGQDSQRYLPQCTGGRPHLNDYEEGGCGMETRALLVGASNIWFAVRKSALSIPHQPRPVELVVAEHWTDLEQIKDFAALEELAAAISGLPMGGWLADSAPYSLEELWEEFVKQRDGDGGPDPGPEALLAPEWTALTTRGGARHGVDFAVSDVGPPVTSRSTDLLGGVHQVTRLREVAALTGFTRLDAYDPADTGPARVRRARISAEKTSWAPAAQSRGEGFLLTLAEEAVQAWESRLAEMVEGRHRDMAEAQRAWRKRRGLDSDSESVRPRFVLLHSISHLLMKAVSLRSGYATASINERIYCRPPDQGDFPMAGVLLYTGASDSEGTLGGLVSMGQPDVIGSLIEEATENARICSSDPFCATHEPNGSVGGEGAADGTVHGAACHVCLFVPETSCDHANRYLDRSYVTATLTDSEIAYFE